MFEKKLKIKLNRFTQEIASLAELYQNLNDDKIIIPKYINETLENHVLDLLEPHKMFHKCKIKTVGFYSIEMIIKLSETKKIRDLSHALESFLSLSAEDIIRGQDKVGILLKSMTRKNALDWSVIIDVVIKIIEKIKNEIPNVMTSDLAVSIDHLQTTINIFQKYKLKHFFDFVNGFNIGIQNYLDKFAFAKESMGYQEALIYANMFRRILTNCNLKLFSNEVEKFINHLLELSVLMGALVTSVASNSLRTTVLSVVAAATTVPIDSQQSYPRLFNMPCLMDTLYQNMVHILTMKMNFTLEVKNDFYDVFYNEVTRLSDLIAGYAKDKDQDFSLIATLPSDATDILVKTYKAISYRESQPKKSPKNLL